MKRHVIENDGSGPAPDMQYRADEPPDDLLLNLATQKAKAAPDTQGDTVVSHEQIIELTGTYPHLWMALERIVILERQLAKALERMQPFVDEKLD